MVGGRLAQAVLFIGWLVVDWHKLYCLLGGWVVGGTLAQAVMFIG